MGKIIFLDVDGVLNSDRYFNSSEYAEKAALLKEGFKAELFENSHLDSEAIALLNYVLEHTGASLVFSSTWREIPGGLEAVLRNGVLDRFVGKTPSLPSQRARGLEIQEWMDTNGQPDIFVILDDDDDMAHLKPHLVQCLFEEGLTDVVAAELMRRLNKD